jgi:hypothetical protein
MAMKPIQRSTVRTLTASTKTNTKVVMPPPVGGVDWISPLSIMDAKNAQVLDNFIARPQGAELRGGWQDVLDLPFEGSVNTLMSCPTVGAEPDRLFACVSNKVWDLTSALDPTNPSGSAVESLTVPVTHAYWSWVNYSLKTEKYLCAVAQGAGYFTYDQKDGWVERKITGVVNKEFRHVTTWKQRLWFTQANSSEVFYLGIGEVLGGEAKFFDYGPMFKRGGFVRAITSWTMDGGDGSDDYQLIFGSEGDVLVYKGTDPSNADTYALVGDWYLGKFPKGDRFFTPYGGDVLVLSDIGLTSMQALVTGNASAVGVSNPVVSKIQQRLSVRLSETLETGNWEVRLVPWLDVLLITGPKTKGGQDEHYCLGLTSKGWSTFSAMPIHTGVMHNRTFYFGTVNGRVAHGLDVQADGMLTNDQEFGSGSPIQGRVTSAYTDFGQSANLKRFLMARPIFQCSLPPKIKVRMKIDYASGARLASPGNDEVEIAMWDYAIWDQAYWAGTGNVFHIVIGVIGVGYLGALEMVVTGERGLIYTGAHLTAEIGGML